MFQTLLCQLHGKEVIKGCTKIDCKEKQIFLCIQCVGTHDHETHDINEFSSIISKNLINTFTKQKFEWINFYSNEQNKQLIQLLLKQNNIDKWINKKIDEFSNLIKQKRNEYIQKLTKVVDEILQEIERNEIEMFKQSTYQYRQKYDKINKAYENTFKYAQEFYQFQSPFVLQNKILSEENPEKIKQVKDINQQDLVDLRNYIKEFSQIKSMNVLEFEQLLSLKKIQEILKQENRKESQIEGTISQNDNDGPGNKPPTFQTKQNKLGQSEDGIAMSSSKKLKHQIDQANNLLLQQKVSNINPKKQDISATILENIRYEEIKPSLLQGQGVKFMIFLQADLIIYGTDEKLFSLKNSQQLQQIPLQFDYISCLDKLDNNSFIVGGTTKQGDGVVYKYIKSQLDQFQSLIVFKIQGDFLTMIGMSKESIAFVTYEKQKNRDIKYTLYYCKNLGIPNQFLINQDLGQSKKKKIKIYNMQDNQFCLHLINEYISVILVNEKLKIFQEIKKVDCYLQGSLIPLINELFLFSVCAGEEKIVNKIIDLNQNVSGLTGEYVYQIKSDVLDNFITVLQITEKGKLFIIIIDKYMSMEIDIFKDLGQLDIMIEQSSNSNLLVHFIENMLYIKDAKTDSIKIFKIHLKQ